MAGSTPTDRPNPPNPWWGPKRILGFKPSMLNQKTRSPQLETRAVEESLSWTPQSRKPFCVKFFGVVAEVSCPVPEKNTALVRGEGGRGGGEGGGGGGRGGGGREHLHRQPNCGILMGLHRWPGGDKEVGNRGNPNRNL